MSRPVTITLTVTAPDMGAVREWLAEYGDGEPGDAEAGGAEAGGH